MIRICNQDDIPSIYDIINDAAAAYKGIIPEDRYHEPYMPLRELLEEIENGVVFYGYTDEDGQLMGVMGIQDKQDVALIRHAYVRTNQRSGGIGSKLLQYLMEKEDRPILIGTWASAVWAIRFYEKNGFHLVPGEEKERLLHLYWDVPQRQIETSVVLRNRE
ncbi:GNAT family N-acetyltransferase [Paenibacillus lutrae]|uniref:GNAT family N-acetyltransferase n=1 Tax=Paenibacillus lutrae TaxID=2078573 RepID=A0A7X3K0E7_9BACL|nr:GNAT family N-acetyltransferase [Paenibacillus lutrae]MVP01179.1 GNAT family N-acetyltransferase [Paenibacillus lutrae]